MVNKLLLSIFVLMGFTIQAQEYIISGAQIDETNWNKFEFNISNRVGSLASVEIHLDHAHYGDLELLLLSPQGDTAVIFDRTVFGSGNNRLTFTNRNGLYHFIDNSNYNRPFRIAENNISEYLTGKWTFLVRDHISGDEGSVKMFKAVFEDIRRSPSNPNEQDCQGAIPVCNNVYSNVNSYVGTGNIPGEINSSISCLGSGEKNDVWYVMTVQNAGMLNFSIVPNNLSDDYDWAVYDLTQAGCEDIRTNSGIEISCNYSGASGTTGANGMSGSQNNAPVYVDAGKTLVLNVSNFSSTQSGYSLDFGNSTATIFDSEPPSLRSAEDIGNCGESSVEFSFSENILCSSLSTNDLELEGPGGTIYTISSIDGPCANGASYGKDFTINVSPAMNASGTYTLKLKAGAGFVEDNCGNIASAGTVPFQVDGLPVTFSKTDASCTGGLGTASVTVQPGITNISYIWDIGGSTETTSSVTDLAPGNYSVTVSNNSGCSFVQSFTISGSTNFAAPTIDGEDEKCSNEKFKFSTPNVPGSGLTYSWDFGGVTNGSGLSPDSVALPAGTHTITLTASNGSCTSSSTKVVDVEQVRNVSISGAGDYCQNEGFNLLVIETSTPLAGANYSYSWNISNGLSFNNQDIVNIPSGIATSGNYTIQLTGSNSVCSVSSQETLSILAYPTVDLGNNPAICDGQPHTLDAQNPGQTYNWSTGETTRTVSVTTTGTYSVTVTNSAGCSGSDDVQVNASPSPTVDLGNDTAVCEGESITLDAENPGMDYSWNTGATTRTISINSSGDYEVSVSNVNGCSNSSSMSFTVNTLPSVSFGIDTTICQGGTLVLDAENPGMNYNWNTGQTSRVVNITDAGYYSVIISDDIGCQGSGDILVAKEFIDNPFLEMEKLICQGTTITLEPDLDLGYNVGWESNLFSDVINVSEGGVYRSIVSTDNCNRTFEINVIEIDTPKAIISDLKGKDYYCFEEEQTRLVIQGDQPGLIYDWDDFGQAREVEIIEGGNYPVTVSNDYCSSRVNKTVPNYCEGRVFVPNAFTPRYSFGLNDVFKPVTYHDISDYEFKVYNKWGELIYSTSNIDEGWDGTINGNPAQMDIYTYHLTYYIYSPYEGETQKILTGAFTLLQ